MWNVLTCGIPDKVAAGGLLSTGTEGTSLQLLRQEQACWIQSGYSHSQQAHCRQVEINKRSAFQLYTSPQQRANRFPSCSFMLWSIHYLKLIRQSRNQQAPPSMLKFKMITLCDLFKTPLQTHRRKHRDQERSLCSYPSNANSADKEMELILMPGPPLALLPLLQTDPVGTAKGLCPSCSLVLSIFVYIFLCIFAILLFPTSALYILGTDCV